MNSIISDVKHIETIHSIVIRGISIHSDSTWSLIDSIKLDRGFGISKRIDHNRPPTVAVIFELLFSK